jgi:hypothetical protein
MCTIHRSRTVFSVFVAVFAITLAAPIAVDAEEQVVAEEQILVAQEQVPALAPVAGPSWDETSGYGSVEASRAAASALLAPSAAPSWDDTSGYGSVEASRASIGYPAPVANPLWDAISEPNTVTSTRRGTALYGVSVPSPSWDETSGYGSVEASRAAASALRTPVVAAPDCIAVDSGLAEG